ncbi:hypothetical protein ACGFYY_05290 [Streptomyces sp. NPDC048331]|uniref:hypothetical protein n=1 Tax=Streptomyces sp. NPDC048331 TaxID=3365534 RepID=UPI0037186B57
MDEAPGSEAPWREVRDALSYLRQIGQVAGLLVRAGILPEERDDVAEIAATLRAAIGYRLYTRTQPLTAPQLSDDLGLGTPPRLTAHALETLREEGALVRKGGLYWVRDDCEPLPTARDLKLARLRSQLAGGAHPRGRAISEDAVAATLGIGKYEAAGYLGILKGEDLVWGTAWAWVPTMSAARTAGPPRLPLPVLPGLYSRKEILDAVTPLTHNHHRLMAVAVPDSAPWHRTRAMAAQVIAALPPARDGKQELAFGLLREIATALAPYEPWARAWHTACLAHATVAALVLLPLALPGDPSGAEG